MLELDDETRAELGYGQKAIAFDEATRVINRAPTKRRWIPAFVRNDLQLQTVLLHAAIQYAYREKPIPPDFVPDLDTVVRIAKERHRKDKNRLEHNAKETMQRMYQRIVCIEKCGGYVSFIAAIAFRTWRLFYSDVDIARDLSVDVATVTDTKQVLVSYAVAFDFPTYMRNYNGVTDGADIVEMWALDCTIREIAKRTGHSPSTIRKYLKRRGIYKFGRYTWHCRAAHRNMTLKDAPKNRRSRAYYWNHREERIVAARNRRQKKNAARTSAAL